MISKRQSIGYNVILPWVALFLIIHLSINAFTQPQNAHKTSLNASRGLSGLKALKTHIDDEYNVWVETEIGLDFWDGSQFSRVYPPGFPKTNHPTFRGHIANYGEDDNRIYIVYKDILHHYDTYNKLTKSFNTINYPKQLLIDEHLISGIDKKGYPWVASSTGDSTIFFSLADSQYIHIRHPANFGRVKRFTFCSQGIWLADSSYNTALISDNEIIKVFSQPQLTTRISSKSENVAFACNSEGDLIFSISGYSGLFRVDTSMNGPALMAGLPDDELVIDCWIDKHDRILAAISNEYLIIRHYLIKEPDKQFKTWDFLANKSVIPTEVISEDFYELIHFGTHQGLEIYKFHVPYINVSLYAERSRPNEYSDHVIRAIIDMDGEIFATDEDPETFRYDKAEKVFRHAGKPLILNVSQNPTYNPHSHTIYSYERIKNKPTQTYFKSYNIRTKKAEQILLKTFITSICYLPDSFIVISSQKDKTFYCHLYNVFTSEIKQATKLHDTLLSKANVNYHFYDEEKQELYFCTFNKGLLVSSWSDGRLGQSRVVDIPQLPKVNIISLNKTKSGNLLVGTYKGLFIVDTDHNTPVHHISTADGLSNNVITGVEEDNEGSLWVATFYGLNVVSQKGQLSVGRFFVDDGLPHNEFNRNANVKDSQGMLHFGTGNGVVTINPKQYHTYESPFDLQFGYYQFNPQTDEEERDSTQREIINVSVKDFTSMDIYVGNNDWGMIEDATYYYKITGLDDRWYLTRKKPIRIDRLPEGQYNIEIKGLSKHGKWSNNTLSLPTNVIMPFFDRLWVRISLLFLLILSVGLALYLIDRRRLHQRLVFQRRVSNLELSLLQSQMNPHFIFNALGAIQYYIFNKDKDLAEAYLSKFASLMRMFLESSRNKTISLKDEIALLKGYIELEHLRFPDKFESEVIVDLDTTLELYELPSMLIQPFIENAINHGIFHSPEKGKLIVHFYLDGDFLVCEIDDNGIGRAESKKIRMGSVRKHKSRSTQITEERIEILKESENMHIDIDYHDYGPDTDGRTGTLVKIKFPLQKRSRNQKA